MAAAAPGDPDAIAFVLALGRALHRYGTPAHRLEQALHDCCARMDLAAEVFSTPTTILMSFGAPAELRTRMMRVEGGELDMGKLERLDALADEVASRRTSPADGLRALEAILAARPQFGRLPSMAAAGVTTGAMAVLIGGGAADAVAAAAIGLVLGALGQVARRSTDQARVFELLGAAVAAAAAGLATAAVPTISPSVVTVASLLVLLPGLSLTVAMTELATRNLIAGTARLMSAVIVLLELVVGVAIGERLAGAIAVAHPVAAPGLPGGARWVALAASALGVGVLTQARVRALGWIVATSALAYAGQALGTRWLGGQLGVMVGAFALFALANAYARALARPAQVVALPALLLLVPGSLGFRGMSSLLDRDTVTGVETVFAMFVTALAIVAGLLLANAVLSPRRSL